LREAAVRVPHPKLRAVSQWRDPNAFSVDVRPVRRRQVVQNEESALEDDLGVMSRDLRVAQNDVVARIATDCERAVRLKAIALLCPVQADEEQLGHRPILSDLDLQY